MGLAASQARLLTITARKSDCEFQSMSLSHQKIALARDMERVSEEYQKSLNQTKLVYDYYGSGLNQMNLDYSILMTPSVYNDYYPKVLTDQKNRLVLDARYAAAARAAGIPAEGYSGTPSSVIRNRFIEALCDNALISGDSAMAVKSITYNNAVGLGYTYDAVTATRDVTWDEVLEMIKLQTQDVSDYGLMMDSTTWWNSGDAYPNKDLLRSHGKSDLDLSRSFIHTVNVGTDGNGSGGGSSVTNFTLYDLLMGEERNGLNYVLTLTEKDEDSDNLPAKEAVWLQQYVIGNENSSSFLNWMTDQFVAIFGGVSVNDQALQYAYDQVYDLVYPNEDLQVKIGDNPDNISEDLLKETFTKVEHDYDSDRSVDVYRKSVSYLGGVFQGCGSESTSGWDGGDDRRVNISISLTNLAKVFLTAYIEYIQGLDNTSYSYEKGQTTNGRDRTTKASLAKPTNDQIFTIAAGEDLHDGTSDVLAGFFDTLFNLICTQGWTQNEKISQDSSYMQEMLKNGSIFISSLNNDGMYYQGAYNVDSYIQEIADTEGIAQAEAKYNAEKAKIENKENRIDLKMKNLDTEISSLTTEYDSVKGVISKAIEKSFKRYEA